MPSIKEESISPPQSLSRSASIPPSVSDSNSAVSDSPSLSPSPDDEPVFMNGYHGYGNGHEVEMNIEETQEVVDIASTEEEEEEEEEGNDSGSTTESEEFHLLDEEGNPIPNTRENIMAVAEARIKRDMQDANYEATPDPSPLIKFFAVGADMCDYYMLKICPDANLLGIARLDNWMYCVDADVEDVCCYQNILPLDTQPPDSEPEPGYNTRGKVIYGILWEVHENTLFKLLSMDKTEEDAQLGMARVDVMRLECEKGFGPAFAFGMGWGLKRRLREIGTEADVVTFTGKPGRVGLGQGFNERVNRGIVEGCMRGVPDEWVESDVRLWVQYPSQEEPVLLK
ncbi:04dc93ce-a00d-4ce4-a987-a246ca85211f [Sclerotinia trifoliorum]|uniref:04dc93ce-a00d-4ce4-a987-a246ca85211f n=1 Tax=Sclerotinia trifoliorum TaxID=28548 RepID=A0A8H2ZNN3_9HELO|nr:04dc93ce-a00d-4ce4-a987-a246ca85211f [Sclerotinia trifoliorum]